MTVVGLTMPPDPDEDRASFLARTLKSLQTNTAGAAPAVAASYTLTGAILLLGGIGYALDVRYDTAPVFVVIGLLLGVAAGLYHLAKMLWRR